MTNDKNSEEYGLLKKSLEVTRFWDEIHEYDANPDNAHRTLDTVLEENIQIQADGDPEVEKELRRDLLANAILHAKKRKKKEATK